MMKRRIVGLLGAALLVSIPAAAHADPVAITGGFFGTDFSFTDFHFVSDRFSLFMTGGSPRPTLINLTGVDVGVPLDFSLQVTTNFDGTGTVDGTTYDRSGTSPSFAPLAASTNLLFHATPITFAQAGGFSANTPFTLSGLFQLRTGEGTLLLQSGLTGSGTLNVEGSLSRFNAQPSVGIASMSFRFADENAAPTPEPATALLVGSALAFGARRIRRKR